MSWFSLADSTGQRLHIATGFCSLVPRSGLGTRLVASGVMLSRCGLGMRLYCKLMFQTLYTWKCSITAAFGKNVGTCKTFLGGCGIGRLLGLSRGVH